MRWSPGSWSAALTNRSLGGNRPLFRVLVGSRVEFEDHAVGAVGATIGHAPREFLNESNAETADLEIRSRPLKALRRRDGWIERAPVVHEFDSRPVALGPDRDRGTIGSAMLDCVEKKLFDAEVYRKGHCLRKAEGARFACEPGFRVRRRLDRAGKVSGTH